MAEGRTEGSRVRMVLLAACVWLVGTGCDLPVSPDARQQGTCTPETVGAAAVTAPVIRDLSFPIVAWHGIPGDLLDAQRFEDLAKAGFTINFTAKGNETQNLRILELAEAAGVKAILEDFSLRADSPFDAGAVEMAVSTYREHPALFGYIIREEPPVQSFEAMAQYRAAIEAADPDHMVYSNIYPAYALPEWMGTSDYDDYLTSYMEVVEPELLSSAYYPFNRKGFRRDYFEAMERIRQVSLEAGIPFWAFAMVAWIEPQFPEPRESWIRFQVFSGLAHGAGGIEIFPYALPSSPTEDFRSAILDSAGDPTPMYHLVRDINLEVLTLAPTLRDLQSVRVCVAPRPFGNQSVDWSEGPVSSSRDLQVMMGHFRDSRGDDYLFLVSLDFDAAGEVQLELASPWVGLTEIDKGTGGMVEVGGNGTAAVPLEAGDGRLFRLR